MACDYDWQDAIVVKTFSGFVTGPEFIESAETIAADPRFDELKFIVNDFLAISGHSIAADTYLEVAASRVGAARTNPNFRVLFIAAEPVAGQLRAAVEPGAMAMHFDPWFFASRREAGRWIAEQPTFHDFRATDF